VETIHLDLPAVAGAFTRRLHDAGLPVTAARSADLARALALVRPVSRRRLYWTARAVLVSDPAQVAVFDSVFRSVFGSGAAATCSNPNSRRRRLPSTSGAAPGRSTSPRGVLRTRARGYRRPPRGATMATRWTATGWPARERPCRQAVDVLSRTSWRSSTS
jgi:uncharacterized protein with von Willebrand factor type A (vWA) domain